MLGDIGHAGFPDMGGVSLARPCASIVSSEQVRRMAKDHELADI